MFFLVFKRYDPGASREIYDGRLFQAQALNDLSGSIESREIQSSSDSDASSGLDVDEAEGTITNSLHIIIT